MCEEVLCEKTHIRWGRNLPSLYFRMNHYLEIASSLGIAPFWFPWGGYKRKLLSGSAFHCMCMCLLCFACAITLLTWDTKKLGPGSSWLSYCVLHALGHVLTSLPLSTPRCAQALCQTSGLCLVACFPSANAAMGTLCAFSCAGFNMPKQRPHAEGLSVIHTSSSVHRCEPRALLNGAPEKEGVNFY